MRYNILFFIFFIFFFNPAQSQTPDCNKFPFYPANHIRNPSLEQIVTSCEDHLGSDSIRFIEMSKVIPFWQMPVSNYESVGYFGVCNNFYHVIDPAYEPPHLPIVPRPIPDGRGVIGLLCMRSKTGTHREDSLTIKDYISTNLFRVLKRDSLYRLDFALGFGKRDTLGKAFYISGSPVRFTLFGLKDSTKIPFRKPSIPGILGCLPLHFPAWVELGSVVISGDPGTWQRGIIDFVAPAEIQSIAIGPACDNIDIPYTPRLPGESMDYYFIDDLKFFQASTLKPNIGTAGGRYCSGDSITLRITSGNFYSGSNFQWYRNNIPIPETNPQLTVSETKYGEGWYKFRLQNDSVCIMSDSLFVHWEPEIEGSFGNNPDTSVCSGDTVILKINGGATASYLWNTGSTDSSVTVTSNGFFSVKASNACNSIYTSKEIIFKDCPPLVFVPTAFTPNGDGLNDVFRASATGRLKSFSLSVYDRFGQRIFFSNDPAKGWDGTVKNKHQGTGMWIWMLQYIDGSGVSHANKGTVTLIR